MTLINQKLVYIGANQAHSFLYILINGLGLMLNIVFIVIKSKK